MAEGEGFEPPDLSINGFQDRRLKPLGHPSCEALSMLDHQRVRCQDAATPLFREASRSRKLSIWFSSASTE